MRTMRLWSIHPRHLDAKGLVALWREGLLAQKVLAGGTSGYVHHPQLQRFRAAEDPQGAIGRYLFDVAAEALQRGYRFDAGKIVRVGAGERLTVTAGQVAHEWRHLLDKLALRDPQRHARQRALAAPAVHPMFTVVPGGIEPWERVS